MRIILILALSWSAHLSAQENDDLRRAESAYMVGDYAEASRLYLSIDPNSIHDPTELGHLNLLCARIKTVNNELAAAETCLKEAFALAPNLRIDPYVDRPSIVARWREMQATAAAATPPQRGSFKRGVKAILSLAPMGVGSFVNDRFFEGSVFALSNAFAISACASTERNCVTSGLAIPALWGYELNENLPYYGSVFPTGARIIYELMPLFPFGVAQCRNHEPNKALTLAIIQLVSLRFLESSSERSQTIGVLGFGVSYAYGLFDGWYNSDGKVEAPGLLDRWHARWNVWFSEEHLESPGFMVSVRF